MALLGIVIPKRHARRAVTRNAIRRLVRAAVGQLDARLPPGVWLVRLRASPDAKPPGAAVSPALKTVVRAELSRLFVPVLVAPTPRAAAGHPSP